MDALLNIRIELNQEVATHRYPRYTPALPETSKPTNGINVHDGNNHHHHHHHHPPPDPITTITTITSPPTSRRRGIDEKSSPSSPGSSTASRPRMGERGRDGTVRFMLDAGRARQEKAIVAEYFKVESEEYVVHVVSRQAEGRGALK